MKKNKIDFVDFFVTVGLSKRLLRSGWIRGKVKDPESVAEHSFRVGVMAMVLSDKLGHTLNAEKMIKMALLHDLGEVITGDIVTERWGMIDIKKRDQKELEEEEGIRQIFDKIGEGDQYVSIFHEMIGRATLEAKIFWQLDKMEMALQALEYEKEQGKNLEEFFITTKTNHLKEPLLLKIFDEVEKKRLKVGKKGKKV